MKTAAVASMHSNVRALTDSIDAELHALPRRSSSLAATSFQSISKPEGAAHHLLSSNESSDHANNTSSSLSHHSSVATSFMLKLETAAQRQRVEGILQSFSHQRSASESRLSLRSRHTTSSRVNASDARTSSQLRSTQASVSVPFKGTVEQVLISEAHNEVVELRRSLINATEALHKAQTDLLAERSLRIQAQDDAARAQREVHMQSERLEHIEASSQSTIHSLTRDVEMLRSSVEHLQRVCEQQKSQLSDSNQLRKEWESKCDEKDADVQRVLAVLRECCDDRDALRSMISDLREEHERVLGFVDGPLAAFARDAAKVKQHWTALEVSTAGDIRVGNRKPETLEHHRHSRSDSARSGEKIKKEKLSKHRSVEHVTHSNTPDRKFIEKILTDAALERQVIERLVSRSVRSEATAAASKTSIDNVRSAFAAIRPPPAIYNAATSSGTSTSSSSPDTSSSTSASEPAARRNLLPYAPYRQQASGSLDDDDDL